MKGKLKLVIAVVLLGVGMGAQTRRDPGGFDPDIKQCQTMAKGADDPLSLQSRPASDLNELDWRLGVCVGKFVPLSPTGVPLILSAHGHVADVLRMRMERAIKALPVEEQARVWAAFNADHGTISASETMESAPSIEQQSKCSTSAEAFFKNAGYSHSNTLPVTEEFVNHYNSKLRKCFVLIKSFDMKSQPGHVLISHFVFDAIEGKGYGSYIWESDKQKAANLVPPLECEAVMSDGVKKHCQSKDEFVKLMAEYIDVED